MTLKPRKNGFVLLLVISLIALIGIYMIILASDANIYIFQADRAYLQACSQNLAASGLNWAKKKEGALKTAAKPVELDTSKMGIKDAELKVNLTQAEIEIKTSCSKARQTLNLSRKYDLQQ